MKVKSENETAQLSPTLGGPMDCSLPGSSVHGIFQARVLERVAIAFSNFHKAMLFLGDRTELNVKMLWHVKWQQGSDLMD